MRYMIMVKGNDGTEAGAKAPEALIAEMAAYHEELQKAGVLLDASGLQITSKGWRIKYSGKKRTVIDGPFTEAKELIARLEGQDGEIEVRLLYELEDFGPSEAIERFRELERQRA